MKLVLAIVQGEDASQTVQALSSSGISVTRFASSGGFLQKGFANNVHIPKKLEMAPMIEQTQKSAGCAIRRAANTAGNFRMMYRMSTNRNTMDTHQITVMAAWKTR